MKQGSTMNTFSKTISLSAALLLLLAGCSSQQQVSNEGASQVASSSQAQQVAEDTCPSCNAPKVEPVVTEKPSKPVVANGHVHPANKCTKSIRHTHPNGKRSHSHKYSCSGVAQGNRWTHGHPANRCTKSIRHTHKSKGPHSHKYSCQGNNNGSSINVQALQRKLKAKGYYKGPINGVINSGTRAALQRYQQRRK